MEAVGEEVGDVDDGGTQKDGRQEQVTGELGRRSGRLRGVTELGQEVAGGHLEEEAGGDGEQDDRAAEGEGPPDGEQAAGKGGEGVGEEEKVVGDAGFAAAGGEDDGVHAVAEIVGGDADGDGEAGGVGGGVGKADGHAVAQAVEDEQGSADFAEGAAGVPPVRSRGVERVLQAEEKEERKQRDAEDVGGTAGEGAIEREGFGEEVEKGGAEQKTGRERNEQEDGTVEADDDEAAGEGRQDGNDEEDERQGNGIVRCSGNGTTLAISDGADVVA